MRKVDYLIVGQGLAGTSLAWELHRRGKNFLIVDRGATHTASRIAAGLITPITGQRLVLTWRYRELIQDALRFYFRVQHLTGVTVLHTRPMLRLLASEYEQTLYEQKLRPNPELSHLVSPITPALDPAQFSCSPHGFQMQTGWQVDVPLYLNASRSWFEKRNAFQIADLDPWEDVEWGGKLLHCQRLQLQCRRMILCQGFERQQTPWFPEVKLDAAKGEILTLSLPNLKEQRILHRGIWLAHVKDSVYRLGATYDRENLNSIPTPDGREYLLDKLREMLSDAAMEGCQVIDHQAAVRPIVVGRHPIVGMSRELPWIGYFNGLGSKGSLQAPWTARQFCDYLWGTDSLIPEINLRNRFPEVENE